MGNYDSILKEDKKYVEPVKEEEEIAKFPWFQTNFILITIVLIISYIVYYNLILTPDKVFYSDVFFFYEKYLSIFDYIDSYNISDTYNLGGSITLGEYNYDLLVKKDISSKNITLSIDDNFLDYYSRDKSSYLKASSYNDNYYTFNSIDYSKVLNSVSKYFSSGIEKNKFIKKVYISNVVPIVESNLVMDHADILKALNVESLKNTYQVLFTFKNNAVTNDVISMKVIINNLTNGKRVVLLYQNGYLIYNDGKDILKFEFSGNRDDFKIKVYRDDVMYGVFSGIKSGDNYQYLYQVIDKIYTLSLDIKNSDDKIVYAFKSNIEKNTKIEENNLVISLESVNEESADGEFSYLEYNELDEVEKEKYQSAIESVVLELKNFINKYIKKNNILF